MATKTAEKKSSKSTKRPVASVRKKKPAQYKAFKLQKRIKHPASKLTGSFRLFGRSIKELIANWRIIGGILLIAVALNFLFVKQMNIRVGIEEVRQEINTLVGGNDGGWAMGATLFSLMLGSAASTSSEAASIYQLLLFVLLSLVTIWALRQIHAKAKLSVKDAFYKSTYPLIPFLLVMFVICLQLVPLLIGSSLYGIVTANGLAVTTPEQILWLLLFALLALLSLYMVSSSLFALYIVTLPDMTPMKALRSARQIVRYRRWSIMRKVLFLPIALVVIAAAIIVPLIVVYAPLAEWVFFVLTSAGLIVFHGFLYNLYRELL